MLYKKRILHKPSSMHLKSFLLPVDLILYKVKIFRFLPFDLLSSME